VRTIPAFTLIELILVMVVITIALGLVTASLGRWSQGSKLKNAAEQIIATAGWARSQAISTANVYRLEIDASSGICRVTYAQDGSQRAPTGEFGKELTMPTDFRLDLRTGGSTGSTIEFYPNGRTTVATIRVTSPKGDWIEVGSESAAERFRVLAQN
jgi:Tfp pilus assembly protein FimT